MSVDEATGPAPDETTGSTAPAGPTRPGYAEALGATSPVRTMIGVIAANVLGAVVVAVYLALAGQPDEVRALERAVAPGSQ